MADSYGIAQWLVSNRDFRLHAFHHVDAERGFLEALCLHCVPPDEIVRPEETVLAPAPCERCLYAQGMRAAEQTERWHD
jgi:hypothetical protein